MGGQSAWARRTPPCSQLWLPSLQPTLTAFLLARMQAEALHRRAAQLFEVSALLKVSFS